MKFTHLQLVLSGTALCVSAGQISRLFDQSVWSEINESPLKVQLRESSNAVEAVVTNRGLRGTYYPLSAKDLVDSLQLYTPDDHPLPKVHPHNDQNGTSPLRYQLLLPGASVVQELDILEQYDLAPGEQYYIQVGGYMPYYHEGQQPSTADFQAHIFEADILPFTAPAQLPPKRWVMAPTTSNVIVTQNCADADMNAKLIKAVPHALVQAKKSLEYVQNGKDRAIMKNFFKADDDATKTIIIKRLKAMIAALETTTGPSKIECSSNSGADARNHQLCVAAGAVAMTDPVGGKVSICPGSKRFPVEFRSCGDSNWGGTLIHELTHSSVVFKPVTTDITYSLQGCKGLSTQRALSNANNFNFLADSVMLGRSC